MVLSFDGHNLERTHMKVFAQFAQLRGRHTYGEAEYSSVLNTCHDYQGLSGTLFRCLAHRSVYSIDESVTADALPRIL